MTTTPKRRTRILVNPSARSGRGARALAPLLGLGELVDGVRIEWQYSRSAAHFMELVQHAQQEREELHALGIAGGDGTVMLAAAALSELGSPQRVPLGILPTGSGNDFAHALGLKGGLSAAFRTIIHGSPRPVDLGEITPGGQRFCCVASVGLDELALRRIHSSIFPRSMALNIYAALRALIDYQPRAIDVRWEGGHYRGEVMFCAVTNTRSYGGGFCVSPTARIDDGSLNLCIVPAMPKIHLLTQFPRILRGTHGELPGIILIQSPWVELAAVPGFGGEGNPMPLCIDGEPPSGALPFRLRCLPGAIMMISEEAAVPGRGEVA